jgi:hypothetical protein
MSPDEWIEDVYRRSGASIVEIQDRTRRRMQEIMAPTNDNSDRSTLFGRLRRMRADALTNAERLRSEVLERLSGVVDEPEAPLPAQRALPPAPDDVIEAEIVEDAVAPPATAHGRVLDSVSDTDQTHLDYMELFSMTDPDAARRKLEQIQQRDRDRLERQTRSGLTTAGLTPTRRR